MDKVPPSTECLPGSLWPHGDPLRGQVQPSILSVQVFLQSSSLYLNLPSPWSSTNREEREEAKWGEREEGSSWAKQWRSELGSQKPSFCLPLLPARGAWNLHMPFQWESYILGTPEQMIRTKAMPENILESMVAHGCIRHIIQAQTPWSFLGEALSQLQERQLVWINKQSEWIHPSCCI